MGGKDVSISEYELDFFSIGYIFIEMLLARDTQVCTTVRTLYPHVRREPKHTIKGQTGHDRSEHDLFLAGAERR